MRTYLKMKLIIETLKSHPGQAFRARELEALTEIPIKTLRSNLRHLFHEKKIQKKLLNIQTWNKKKTRKVGQTQSWYYIRDEDVPSTQPSIIST